MALVETKKWLWRLLCAAALVAINAFVLELAARHGGVASPRFLTAVLLCIALDSVYLVCWIILRRRPKRFSGISREGGESGATPCCGSSLDHKEANSRPMLIVLALVAIVATSVWIATWYATDWSEYPPIARVVGQVVLGALIGIGIVGLLSFVVALVQSVRDRG